MLIGLDFVSVIRFVVLVAVVAGVGSVAVVKASNQRGNDRSSTIDRLAAVWLIAALVTVAVLTLQPGPGGFDGSLPSQLNLLGRLSVPGARANFVLYLPVGLFAAILWRSKARPLVWATGLSFLVSFTVEVAQWVLPISRAAESHDVFFNMVGGFVGALAGAVVVRVSRDLGADDA